MMSSFTKIRGRMRLPRIRFLTKWMKRLRRLASIILFVMYIAIGVSHLQKVDNPRDGGTPYRGWPSPPC